MFRKFFKKAHDIREDFEDFFADKVLAKLDKNTKIDELEKKGIIALLEFAEKQYGQGQTIPKEAKEKLADSLIVCLGKANKALQKQLKKRHAKVFITHQ